MERFEQWKDLKKESIKEPKDKIILLQWGGWSSSCFFYICLRAFGAQAVHMCCCRAYVLVMIRRIHQTPRSYKPDIPQIFSRYPQHTLKIQPR